jgi:AMMECR1 domain-containing protein
MEEGAGGAGADPGKPGAKAGGGASMLTPGDKTFIVELARKSIEDALNGRATTPGAPPGESLKQAMGSIVIIEMDGRIQGTGRELSLSMPFYESVVQAARSSVLGDPRYPTPPADKVHEMIVSVYAVSELKPVEEFQVETIGGDGYIISSKNGEGIVPPQEPAKKGWSKEEALKNGCRRANLMVDCYKESNRKREGISFTTMKGAAL